MAEPAYEQLEEYEVPAGGIADFVVSDEEIEAMDRRDAERAFGSEGIANFKDVAARMADYGRYGDDTVAHLQTGEIVIPAALIADNPALKESIFDDLRARGIEDPERYVVGSPENSINPDTGLPEFFLKKLFKGVKKAFKKVGKFLKKAAGVILPIALSFTPLGPVFGAALGSGIASLIQGGNLKDAFKAAAIAGATGGILKGISSAATGGTFTGGVREAVSGFGGRLSQTASGLGSTLTGGGLTGAGNLFTGYVPTAGAAGAGAAAGPGAVQPPQAGLPPVVDAQPSVINGQLTPKGLAEQLAGQAGGVSGVPVTDAVPVFDRAAVRGAENLASNLQANQGISAALDAKLQTATGGALPTGPGGTVGGQMELARGVQGIDSGYGFIDRATMVNKAAVPGTFSRSISMLPGETVQEALARTGRTALRTSGFDVSPGVTAVGGTGRYVESLQTSFPSAGAGAAGVTQAAAPGAAPPVAPPPAADVVSRMPLDVAAPLSGAGQTTAQTQQQSFIRKFIPDPVEDFYDQYLSPSRPGSKLMSDSELAQTDAFRNARAAGATYSEALASAAKNQPGFIRRYAPLAALGAAGLYAGGFFETPEQEELTIGYPYTGFDLLAQNPEYYGLPGGYIPPVYTPPPNIPDMTAAEGGEVYPRRNGGIMPYEGTPDEDSVRALLMPGEFVMTKDAVRGLGNGSMDRGIKNMYSVMRDLERRGRVA